MLVLLQARHAAIDLVGGLPARLVSAQTIRTFWPARTLLDRLCPRWCDCQPPIGVRPASRVALGDPVPDDPDLGGEVLLTSALRRRDDLLVPGRAGELAGEALPVDLEDGGALTPFILGAALAEPAQVQRQVGVASASSVLAD